MKGRFGSCNFTQPFPSFAGGFFARLLRSIFLALPDHWCMVLSRTFVEMKLERKVMPRSATIIFGLVLVAFSIGFNTWRYPVVWQMVSPASASAAAVKPPTATPAVQPENPATAEPKAKPKKKKTTPPPALATQTEVKPILDVVAKKPAADAPLPSEAKLPDVATAATTPPAANPGLPASTSLEKPLVAVPKLMTVEKPIVAAEVHRLPPVDPNVPLVRNVSASPGGAIRVYPSTGIE